jgi:phage tail-like protein
MSEQSSYLRYLPRVLWQDEPAAPQFSLGSMLRIFEKLLTGIPDGVSIAHGDHEHAPIMTQIDGLPQLFDPWTTPAALLPWLASWVALQFPTLQGVALWDEYQQRKVTAQTAQIYRLRGRKAGLNLYLDLYAVGRTQPRVALDDGSRLLSVTPQAAGMAAATGLVSQGPVVTSTEVIEGLTRPWCIGTDSGGNLLVGDIGLPSNLPVQLPDRVWRLDPVGNYDVAGTPPKPQPLAPGSLALKNVVAVTVRPAQAAAPETLYVLDRSGTLYAIPAPFPGTPATQVTALAQPGASIWPVAMTVDPASGDLLVLDRGGQPGNPSAVAVITIKPAPLTVTRSSLPAVTEPLSLAVNPDGTLLVGDGGDQDPAGPEGFPGNLVLVDRVPAPWTQTPLLPAANPLVAPTGIARMPDGRLFVLDTGVKPFAPSATDPFICAVAQDAGIFQVDLTSTPPSAARITGPGQFVYPTGMIAAGARLVVCDPGQPEVLGLQPYWSRVRPYQFGVVIHFADSRLPPDPAARQLVLAQAVGNIRTIIEDQKPAHTVWDLITAI